MYDVRLGELARTRDGVTLEIREIEGRKFSGHDIDSGTRRTGDLGELTERIGGRTSIIESRCYEATNHPGRCVHLLVNTRPDGWLFYGVGVEVQRSPCVERIVAHVTGKPESEERLLKVIRADLAEIYEITQRHYA